MIVTPIKTPPVHTHDNLEQLVLNGLESFSSQTLEASILVVTSKVISLCQGNTIPIESIDKHDLVAQASEYFLPSTSSNFNVMLSIKNSLLAVTAGVDESNAQGEYVLLPADSYKTAADIWQFVKAKRGLKKFGVLITDSTSFPLKWGTIGRGLAYCGFAPLKDLRGTPDVFGRMMVMTQMNVAEGLASAAVVEMGEGSESTPLCLIEAATHVVFQDHPPTKSEISQLTIDPADDLYAPFLNAVKWHKGSGISEVSKLKLKK